MRAAVHEAPQHDAYAVYVRIREYLGAGNDVGDLFRRHIARYSSTYVCIRVCSSVDLVTQAMSNSARRGMGKSPYSAVSLGWSRTVTPEVIEGVGWAAA